VQISTEHCRDKPRLSYERKWCQWTRCSVGLHGPNQTSSIGGTCLAPAQCADLIVDIAAAVGFNMMTRQGSYRLTDLIPDGSNTSRQATSILPLASPDLPNLVEPTQHLTLSMMGRWAAATEATR